MRVTTTSRGRRRGSSTHPFFIQRRKKRDKYIDGETDGREELTSMRFFVGVVVVWLVRWVTSVEVMVAASRNHYGGMVAVVASAAAQSGSLSFLLVVRKGEDLVLVEKAARCAGRDSVVRVVDFDLGDWPFGGARPLSHKQPRLSDALNYARFFVGDLFPEDSEVIYLDSDVLVMKDLNVLRAEAAKAFLETPSASVAVVPRDFKKVCGHVVDCQKAARFENVTLETMEKKLHAFNAGVVVIHVKRWKDQGLKEKVETWIARNNDGGLYDLGSNPPLVLAVKDDFVRLDLRWNCMRGIRRQHSHNAACWPGAFIRHFPGDDKPWVVPTTTTTRKAPQKQQNTTHYQDWHRHVPKFLDDMTQERQAECRSYLHRLKVSSDIFQSHHHVE